MSDLPTQLRWLPSDCDATEAPAIVRPFYTFILKVASRCNLNCDYCYVYQSPDQSWKTKPVFLSEETVLRVGERIREHVQEHQLAEISIVYHGGEPLLVGLERLEHYTKTIRQHAGCRVQFAMQTNGSLLDHTFADFFQRNEFRVGISLDGGRSHNDRHRLDHGGQSSYDATISAIKLLQSDVKYQGILGGVLIVIDLANSPRDVLEAIDGLGIRSANLLLPDCNYDSPPERPADDALAYGHWLEDFFSVWFADFPHIEVPYLEEIMNLMLGGESTSEEIGADVVDFVIVDTNGDIEPVDTLKKVGRSATNLGMNVFSHSFDQALQHPAIFSRMLGTKALCKECRGCEFLSNCAGGYIPHRFSSQNGFINPSVYCADLIHLFRTIRSHLSGGISNEVVNFDRSHRV